MNTARSCRRRALLAGATLLSLAVPLTLSAPAAANDPDDTGTVSLPVPGDGLPESAAEAAAAAAGSNEAPAGSPIHSRNVRVTGPNDNTQAELSMASSGPSTVITFNDFSGNGSSFSTTTDGGRTFSAKANPPVPNNSVPCCDPSIVADNNGNFFFLQLYRDDGGANNRCTNSLHVSTDGGRNFSNIVGSPFAYNSGTADFPDQPHMGIDETNLVNGIAQLYTFTRHFTSGINCPQTGGSGTVQGEVTCSTDGGANWAAPAVLAPFTDTAHWGVGVDGSVYLAGNGSGGTILLRRSTNDCQAGLALGTPVTVASGLSYSGVGIDREFPQPQVVADKNNPNIAYVAWSSDRISGVNDRDIFLARCTFTGTTGTCDAPLRINDNPVADNTSQYFPMLCIAPDNTILMAWNDRRIDAANNQQTAIFHTEITAGGALGIAENHRVDDASFAPVNFGGTPDYGDYNENNDACDAKHLYTAWSSQTSAPGITPASNDVDIFFTVINRLPRIAVSGSLAFGTVPAGLSKDLDVTVQNTGDAPLEVTSVAMSGASDPEFSVIGNPGFPQIVQAGGSVDYTVRFAPPAGSSGSRSGNLVIESSDPDNPTVTLSASGTIDQDGVGGGLVVSAGALSFGGVPVDNRTDPHQADLTLAISNASSCCDLTVNSLTFGGANASDFTLVGAPATPFVVPPNGTRQLTVRFNPSAPGLRMADLTVSTSDVTGGTAVVDLSGTGLIPAIGVLPASLTFGPTVIDSVSNGTGATTLSTLVSNPGQAELIVDRLQTSGAPYFAPGPVGNPMRIAPNGSFTENVTFRPTATSRKITGTLLISDDDPEGGPISVTVPLCGEATGRGIRVLVIDENGAVVPKVDRLKLHGKGVSPRVNVLSKNLTPTTLAPPTTCQQFTYHYENQALPAATGETGPNGQGSFYELDVSVGSKIARQVFQLGLGEFREITMTVR